MALLAANENEEEEKKPAAFADGKIGEGMSNTGMKTTLDKIRFSLQCILVVLFLG